MSNILNLRITYLCAYCGTFVFVESSNPTIEAYSDGLEFTCSKCGGKSVFHLTIAPDEGWDFPVNTDGEHA